MIFGGTACELEPWYSVRPCRCSGGRRKHADALQTAVSIDLKVFCASQPDMTPLQAICSINKCCFPSDQLLRSANLDRLHSLIMHMHSFSACPHPHTITLSMLAGLCLLTPLSRMSAPQKHHPQSAAVSRRRRSSCLSARLSARLPARCCRTVACWCIRLV